MTSVGIDELRTRTSEVIRRVREQGETIDVTDDGEVVARMVPAKPFRAEQQADDRDTMEEWLRRADELAKEVGRHWPNGVSAVDAVRDVRRNP